MIIESCIDYHDGGLLNYDPARVRELFFEHFPDAVFDNTNYSRVYLERFFKNVKEKNLEPPEFVIDSYWKLAFQNGPTFKFNVPFEIGKDIVTTIKRFSVAFEGDFIFNDEMESKIIEFLKLLKYGEIGSDQKTKKFSNALEDRKDYWTLKEN